ncbi:MAG: matrixin family metalloprotease [Myxococcota bacterium]|nr:matrixin family metalloprotease [Myxococcota bacterium]
MKKCLSILVLSLLLPAAALAWDPLYTCSGNYTAWRGDTPHTFWNYAQNYPSTDFSEEDSLRIINDSFAEWGVPGCSSFSFEQDANTNDDPMDWQNSRAVGYYEDSWPSYMGQYTLAVTMPSWDYNCDLNDADLVVNGYHHEWTENGWGSDLQSVMTHEVGHFIGLDHSNHYDSTMTATYGGGTSDRTLSCDDTEAACALYPSQSQSCNADHYCPCGESCIDGYCGGTPGAGDNGNGGETNSGDNDDTPAPPPSAGECGGPLESFSEAEPNDWQGQNDVNIFETSGGDVEISATISCANTGHGYSGDFDWFVVNMPCQENARFILDWQGGTSDLDFWVYDTNSNQLTSNVDENYAGPIMQNALASQTVKIAVACWSGPDVPYTLTIDWQPWGSTEPEADDEGDESNPGGSSDDTLLDGETPTAAPGDEDALCHHKKKGGCQSIRGDSPIYAILWMMLGLLLLRRRWLYNGQKN